MKNKIIKFLPITIVCILVTLCIYIIGSSNLYSADDYNYSNIFGTTTRISSFEDLSTSLSGFYNEWTGRILVHGLLQIFLWKGIEYFYILNAIVFALFIFGIIKLFDGKLSLLNFSTILFLLIYCTRAFCEKYIWIAGSVNYLWPACAMVYTLGLFYKGIVKNKKISTLSAVLAIPLCFITGLSQENTAFVTGSFIIFVLLFNIKKLFKMPLKTKLYWLLNVISFGVGAFILIFAPGNFVRMNNSSGSEFSSNFYNILRNLYHIENLIVIYAITCLIMFIKEWNKYAEIENSALNKKSAKSNKTQIKLSEKYIICFDHLKYIILPFIMAILPMVIISEFYDRSMLPYETLILAGIIYNINIFTQNVRIRNKIRLATTLSLTFCSILPLFTNIKYGIQYLSPYKKLLTSQLEEQKSMGSNNLVATKFANHDKLPTIDLNCDNYLDSLSNDIINQFCARFYNVASVSVVPEGYVQLEIDTSISTYEDFCVIDKDEEKIAGRYFNSRHPSSDTSKQIYFEIPKDKLYNSTILLTDEALQSITNITVRDIGSTEEIKKDTLNFGGYIIEDETNQK